MSLIFKRLTRQTDPGLQWMTLSRVMVTLGILLTPVLVLSWTPDVWETTKVIVLLATVGFGWIFYFLAVLRRQEQIWSLSKIDWIVLALWLSLTISALFSVHRWQSFVGLNGSLTEAWPVVTAMIGLYFLAGQAFRTAVEQRAALVAVMTGLGLALVFQIFQFSDFSLLPPSLPRLNPIFSLIGSSLTDVSIMAALFGAMVLLLWQPGMERWQRWSIAAGVILSWLIVLLSGRPIGWAIWAIGMIAVVVREAARKKNASSPFIMVAIFLAALGMAAHMFGLHTRAGLPNGPDVVLDSATTRTITQQALADRPVFGTGGATWYQDFVAYRPASFNQTQFWSDRFVKADTGWWQVTATTGIIGAGLWFVFLLWSVWSLWKRWAAEQNILYLAGLVTAAAVIVSGFFATWSLPLLVMTWFLLGLTRTASVTEQEKKAQPPGLGAPMAFAIVSLSAIGLWFYAGKLYVADIMVQQTRRAIERQASLTTITEQLEGALELNAHQADASILLAGAYLTQAELAIQANDTTTASPLIEKGVTVMRAAVAIDPKNPAIYEAMNNFLNRINTYVADAVNEASQNYLTLQKLEPTNPIHDVGYGQTLMVMRTRLLSGEQSEATTAQAATLATKALAAYDQALGKKADYPQASYAKAQALTDVERAAEAIQILEPLVTLYPDASVFWIELGVAQAAAGDATKAVAAYEQAINAAPTDSTVYLALAEYYQSTERTELAKQIIERGLEFIPNDPSLQQVLNGLNAPATEEEETTE